MKVRFENARWIAIIILVVGIAGIVVGLLFNNNPAGIANFVPAHILWLGVIWAVVGILLLILIRPGDEPGIDANAITSLQSRINTFDTRFKDLDARLDARVGDVNNRFDTRLKTLEGAPSGASVDLTPIDTRMGDFDTRLKALESAPAPRVLSFSNPGQPDDLKIIEGIGPKMDAALKAAGIDTFVKLAAASEGEIRSAIEAAGMSFAPSVPTWPKQAQFIVDGDMAGFEAYVAQLTAGRE
jgi:predicted flap endonuclease-1-like 5' DNA nuclease